MSKKTLKKFLKFMEKWHYEDFNAFENHFNKLISMKSKEQLTNENEALKDSIAVILAQKKNVNNQLDQLKQQLAEKEKENEELKQQNIALENENSKLATELIVDKYQKAQKRVSFGIQLAIAELEKVKDYICDCTYIKEPDYTNVRRKIDNQIKELKGEKDVED